MKRILTIILFSAIIWTTPNAYGHGIADNPSVVVVQDVVMPFTVYPNPLTTRKLVVNVEFEQTSIPVTFSISNVLGQSVFTYTLTSEDYKNGSFSADLGDLSLDKGLYLMKMSRGDKTSVQKLVIK